MIEHDVFMKAAIDMAEGWEKAAADRNAVTPSDAAAAAMVFCAAALRQRMAQVEHDTAYRTVAQFAHDRGLSESLVRRLCASGELEGAEKGVDGDWHIPRAARRVLKRASA